jgi:hypothetical protein
MDPFKSLSFLRYKVLYIHMTNVWDNLPTDEIVVRDGKLYFVEGRAYVSSAALARICEEFGVPTSEFESAVNRLIEVGPKHVHPSGVEKGVTFLALGLGCDSSGRTIHRHSEHTGCADAGRSEAGISRELCW